jgi:hypothetical protein
MDLRKPIRALGFFLLAVIVLGSPAARGDDFSQDQAYAHLKHIAGTIGARPLGSAQERAALTYFAGKIAELGGKVEWQAVSGTGEPQGKSGLNTSSFNVIGRFPGETRREIIVGAHIDSATPEIPGADDDGSGVATMLEAARTLTGETHRSTLLFVAFCGEEAGLVGSKWFVEHYPLDQVALMLQLDMTSGDAPLMLWIDSKDGQSPDWLVSASVEIYHTLGCRDIDYPTIFQSLNSAMSGAGSDHEPFLEKGIPAIAFVSDVRFPIHTRFDTLEYFRPDGLARSGRLIMGLIERFDRGQPEAKTGRYMLVMVGGRPIFIRPSWLAAGIVLSLVVGLAAVLRLNRLGKERASGEEEKRIRKSWPKLLVLHLLMLGVTFSSFALMGGVKRLRLPWVVRPGAYIFYAFLFFFLGVWLSLQILRRWRVRKNAYFYMVRASAYFAVLIAAVWTGRGPRLALFPAAGLLLISLAGLARPSWLKAVLLVLSPVLMFRLLVLPEYYQFLYRSIGGMGLAWAKTALSFWLVNLAVMLVCLLWSHPFLLGFAAVYRSAGGDLLGLRSFRRPLALIPLGALLLTGGYVLARQPGYAPPWVQAVAVTERYDADAKTTRIEFSSGDYLRGITAALEGRVIPLRPGRCFDSVDEPLSMDWLRSGASPEVEERAGDRLVRVAFDLAFEKPPYSVSLILTSDSALKVEGANVEYSLRKNSVRVRWFSHPAASLRPELRVSLAKGAKLEAEVSAVFLEMPRPLTCAGENKSFVYRSEVKRRLEVLRP